jgi:hypothetical protein
VSIGHHKSIFPAVSQASPQPGAPRSARYAAEPDVAG